MLSARCLPHLYGGYRMPANLPSQKILRLGCAHWVASFPGPTQLSVTCSTVLKATESWAGPGNEATHWVYTVF